jgi:hypothetical protein
VVRRRAEEHRIERADECQLILDERPASWVGAGARLGDEVELAVRAGGETVERDELLNDDLSQLEPP